MVPASALIEQYLQAYLALRGVVLIPLRVRQGHHHERPDQRDLPTRQVDLTARLGEFLFLDAHPSQL